MELLIIVLIALVLCLKNSAEEEEIEVLLDKPTLLNPDFYVDENAFMEVADALGFGRDYNPANSANMDMRSESVHSVSSNTADNVQYADYRNGGESQHADGVRRRRNGRVAGVAGTTR